MYAPTFFGASYQSFNLNTWVLWPKSMARFCEGVPGRWIPFCSWFPYLDGAQNNLGETSGYPTLLLRFQAARGWLIRFVPDWTPVWLVRAHGRFEICIANQSCNLWVGDGTCPCALVTTALQLGGMFLICVLLCFGLHWRYHPFGIAARCCRRIFRVFSGAPDETAIVENLILNIICF